MVQCNGHQIQGKVQHQVTPQVEVESIQTPAILIEKKAAVALPECKEEKSEETKQQEYHKQKEQTVKITTAKKT